MIEGRTGGGQNYFGDSTAKGVRFQSALTHGPADDRRGAERPAGITAAANAATIPRDSRVAVGRPEVQRLALDLAPGARGLHLSP